MFFIFIFLLFNVGGAYSASAVTCPPGIKVLQQPLVIPIQNPHDQSQWNFKTAPFSDKGRSWTVLFGSFFEDNLSELEALLAGKAYFEQVKLSNHSPTAWPAGNYFQCDYVPNGRAFWLSAITERY